MNNLVKLNDFQEYAVAWEDIKGSCFTNELFITPLWQEIWFKYFGADSELLILSLHENDITVGIAPLINKSGSVTFIGDTDLCDYSDFIVSRNKKNIFYEKLLHYLHDIEWHSLDLKSIPQESPTLDFLPKLATDLGYTYTISKESAAPMTVLPNNWDEFLLNLSKKSRHELKRKLRRIENAGSVKHINYTDPLEIQRNMDDFFRLHKSSSVAKLEFMSGEKENFFRDVANALSQKNHLILSFLEIDGVRVSSCIIFDYGDTRLLYNSGYDPSYSEFSVGLVNKSLAIKEAILAGKSHFDFLRGAERYKYELGGKDRFVFTLTIQR
tara:strand:- start:1172 stop:2149 length:978 start_codon:yes stop_codon:yes gene_type:complete